MRQAIADIRSQVAPANQPHRGLYFDQLSPGFQSEKIGDFLEAVSRLPYPVAFDRFRRQWEAGIKQANGIRYRATARSAVIVGLGSESVTEVAISLHRTYGVPVIPGSALKGLAASYARNRMDRDFWSPDGEAYKTLFGTTEEAGYVTFFDAMPVMSPGQKDGDLRRDVLTVHHPQYYQKQTGLPADWDSPVPVPFLTARCDFDIALGGPEAWVHAAFEILRLALLEEGIGAKTSSGYGRLELPDIQAAKAIAEEEARKKAEAAARAAAMATMSDMARELELAIEAGGYYDRNKFSGLNSSGQFIIEHWLTKLESNFDANAVKRLAELIREHYRDVMQDPNKMLQKKKGLVPAFGDRQIKFAIRMLALEAKL